MKSLSLYLEEFQDVTEEKNDIYIYQLEKQQFIVQPILSMIVLRG